MQKSPELNIGTLGETLDDMKVTFFPILLTSTHDHDQVSTVNFQLSTFDTSQ